jgi:hypothetical protein
LAVPVERASTSRYGLDKPPEQLYEPVAVVDNDKAVAAVPVAPVAAAVQ